MAVLRAKELTKIYQAGKVSVHALNGISVSIGKGSFTAVIGKSGSGKTTLLNVLSGLEIPDSGTVHLGCRADWVKRPEDGCASQEKDWVCISEILSDSRVYCVGKYFHPILFRR